MNAKLNMDVNLRGVQEKSEDTVKVARNFGRKSMLVSIGMVGLTYDAGMAVWHDGLKFIDKAEGRGEEIEQMLMEELNKRVDQTTGEAKKMKGHIEDQVSAVAKEVGDSGKTVEQEVEKILARVGFTGKGPVPEEIDDIEIERDGEMMEPFEGYDEMVAADVIEWAKSADDTEMLTAVRDYELVNKDRVTVLREVDTRLGELIETESA